MLTKVFSPVVQPEAVYLLPELIPASPGEPWETAAPHGDDSSSLPVHVPLLPTDPAEAQNMFQWLHSLKLPIDDIMGRRPG